MIRVSTTYDTRRASWYESMRIMVAWEAYNDQTETDPFTHRLDQRGHITHGHVAKDNNHGGAHTNYSSFGAVPRPISKREKHPAAQPLRAYGEIL